MFFKPGLFRCARSCRVGSGIRPIPLLRSSLLRLFDSTFRATPDGHENSTPQT